MIDDERADDGRQRKQEVHLAFIQVGKNEQYRRESAWKSLLLCIIGKKGQLKMCTINSIDVQFKVTWQTTKYITNLSYITCEQIPNVDSILK